MKKIISLLFVCFFVLAVSVGCSADNTDSPPDSNTYGNTSGNLNNGGMVAQQGGTGFTTTTSKMRVFTKQKSMDPIKLS